MNKKLKSVVVLEVELLPPEVFNHRAKGASIKIITPYLKKMLQVGNGSSYDFLSKTFNLSFQKKLDMYC